MKEFKKVIGAVLWYITGGRIETKTATEEIAKARAMHRMRMEWRQEELNNEHWKRYGWKVVDGEYVERWGDAR